MASKLGINWIEMITPKYRDKTMARPRKRPEYDPEKIIRELMDAVAESYEKKR